jgi:hypothetical protein
VLQVEIFRCWDSHVEVQLLGYRTSGPCRRLQFLDQLHGEFVAPTAIAQHEPVPIVGLSFPRWLVTGAISQAEQLPVELGKPSRIGGVEDDLQNLGIAFVGLH